jgi:hypothetical protein
MIKTENFDKVEITSGQELRSWLLENFNRDQGIWIVTYKKSEGLFG